MSAMKVHAKFPRIISCSQTYSKCLLKTLSIVFHFVVVLGRYWWRTQIFPVAFNFFVLVFNLFCLEFFFLFLSFFLLIESQNHLEKIMIFRKNTLRFVRKVETKFSSEWVGGWVRIFVGMDVWGEFVSVKGLGVFYSHQTPILQYT